MSKSRRLVEDQSGFCRHSQLHHLCNWGAGYETPSAIITCTCSCHATNGGERPRTLVPKGPSAARVLVPKS